jgi:hypothetical protein
MKSHHRTSIWDLHGDPPPIMVPGRERPHDRYLFRPSGTSFQRAPVTEFINWPRYSNIPKAKPVRFSDAEHSGKVDPVGIEFGSAALCGRRGDGDRT